ncbi:MAG: type II toxin-antitoxin system VapC family toxin [Candidatus Sericytochromatia bacterium]|nr:type II toxin-antitoxin system VapC family toxin [Candidatus Tanganyikabacteria bacterium]
MPWLIDTHVLAWSALEPEKLGPETRSLLTNPENDLLVATISTAEIACLVLGGKLFLKMGAREFVAAAIDNLSASTVELSHAVAAEAWRLPEPFHRDPADRILVATAREHDMVLVTGDDRILRYGHVQVLDARA